MAAYKIRSYAKINAGLKVLTKRKDGYHNIETIFYQIALYDEVSISVTERTNGRTHQISVNTPGKSGLNGKVNICYKAAASFLDKFRISPPQKISITIKKSVPVGAGLGGGSSNAAAVLKALSRHYKLSDSQMKKLNVLALSLGSDVPFFLRSKPAYALSRGEKLKDLPEFKIKGRILIVNPRIHVSTAWAYRELGMKANQKPKRKLFKGIKTYNKKSKAQLVNDFEGIVFRKHPEIENIKHLMLVSGADFAMMSGSGSTVYGVYKKAADLRSAAEFFKRKKYLVFTS